MTAFSVIVPTHNRPAMLQRAVESVLAQDVDDFECLVVDDGGDQALELPDDPRVRLVRHDTNRGLPSALNTGLDDARGEYITFLDDDDVITPDRISLAAQALERADVVLCWSATDGPPEPANRELEGRVFDTILDDRAPPKGVVMIPRAIVPRFDERYLALEDLEWWLRVADHLHVTTVPRVGYRIHHHHGPRSTNHDAARVKFGELLLAEYADYFASHRRAAALRWWTIGGLALQLGDRSRARRALLYSLRAHPTRGAVRTFAKAWRPS